MIPSWLSKVVKRTGPARKADHRARARRPSRPSTRLFLEGLEERTLLTWNPIGPAPITNGEIPGRGIVTGRVQALAADPINANTIYVVASGGGVWKTTNGGGTWNPLTDDQPTLNGGSIAIAPSDRNIIYVGTGQSNGLFDHYDANLPPTFFYGRGVLKSTDAGASWTLLPGNAGRNEFDRRSISKIVVDPANANIVYLAIGQTGINGLQGNTGIWKSTDGGTTWTNTTVGISVDDAYSDLVIDPTNPQVLYCAVGAQFGSLRNAVYKTIDGGANWNLAGDFPTGIDVGRITLAISASNPNVLWASIVEGDLNNTTIGFGNLYKMMRTSNGGVNWVEVPAAPQYLSARGYFNATLAIDPANSNIIYAGGGGAGQSSQIFVTMNNGLNWSNINGAASTSGPHRDHHGIAFDPQRQLLVGTSGGIWRRNPMTGAWANLNGNLQITLFNGIAQHPTDPNLAYGGSQDNGTDKYTGNLAWTLVDLDSSGHVRVDQTSPNTVYHTFPGVTLFRSTDAGMTWIDKSVGISPFDASNFYTPFVLDPAKQTRILYGTNRVYESNDRGDTWNAISGTVASGFVAAQPIDAVAAAASDRLVVYATREGIVYVTRNGGANWTSSSPVSNPTTFLELKDIVVDPNNAAVAYVSAANFNDITGGGHVWRTTNFGLTWTNISGNLPDIPTISLGLDHQNNFLYAGTDTGVFFTADGGATWSKFDTGLPNVQVSDIDVSVTLGTVAAGTYGRGMFVFRRNTVSGFKYDDTNGNGVRDAGEPGVRGVVIELRDPATNNLLRTTITDTTGNYSFPNLVDGSYRVREVQPAGSQQTSTNPVDVTVANGQTASGLDFGNFRLVTVSGTKFQDNNANGIRNAGEPGLQGWTIQLQDAATSNVLATTTTNASGNYTFTGVAAGTFRIREVLQAGWTQTTANPSDITTSSGVNITGASFGNFQFGIISGQVFDDIDGDATSDGGTDPGIAGWTVQLINPANGQVLGTQITDNSGNYTFGTQLPGTYRVVEVLPSGWFQTTPNPANITITTSGFQANNVNFGNFQLININGHKFESMDGSGIEQGTDVRLQGWEIQLSNATTGSLITTVTTDVQGNYSFTNLGPGTYRVREVLQAGWTQVSQNPDDIVALSGNNAVNLPGLNFGNSRFATISGRKFSDPEGDGVINGTEPALQGWTIQLLDPNTGGVLQSSTTDLSGNYSFTNLVPGTYRIREVTMTGWVQTTPNPDDVNVFSGGNVPNINFYNFQLATFQGQVFNDLVQNGTRDGLDAGLAGVVVRLSNAGTGTILDTRTTDASGNFAFANQPPGNYRIRIVVPAGTVQTTPDPVDFTVNSSGQSFPNINFGTFKLATLGGLTFLDVNGNGVRDLPGDVPQTGVPVQLLDSASNVLQATTSDGNGNYRFNNLNHGIYTTFAVAPAGSILTNTSAPLIDAISGTVRTNLDFGIFQLGQISGRVFTDNNGDGLQDPTFDRGLSGFTVQLTNAANGALVQTATTDINGNYSFGNLLAGNYRIREVQQAGFVQTTANPLDIQVQSGTIQGGVTFGNFQLGTISGTAFDDLNLDGIQNPGEPGLDGYSIQLFNDVNGNGRIDSTDALFAATTTAGGGRYSFANLAPNNYIVAQVKRPGQIQLSPAGGQFASPVQSGLNLQGNFANLGDATRSYVFQIYQDMFGRRVDIGGLNFWAGQINQGLSRAGFVNAVINSVEFRTNQVQDLYRALLGRSADPTGLKDAVSLLLNTPAVPGSDDPIQQLRANIIGSAEYFQRNGSTNSAFLSAVYRDVLGRAIDPTGLSIFGNALANGLSRTLVAKTIMFSTEGLNRLVNGLYQRFLRRDADPFGLNAFVSLVRAGQRTDDVIRALVASSEYFARL